MPTPITSDERNRIVEAIRSGCPRNEIARQSGRSPGSISRIAQQEGLTFDRSFTKKASSARKADLAYVRERRLELIDLGLKKQRELLEQANTPHKMQAWWIGLGIGIDKRRADEETENDLAGFDKVFQVADRMGDEYESVQSETGAQHIEGDG